jgi:hypothetical protein
MGSAFGMADGAAATLAAGAPELVVVSADGAATIDASPCAILTCAEPALRALAGGESTLGAIASSRTGSVVVVAAVPAFGACGNV